MNTPYLDHLFEKNVKSELELAVLFYGDKQTCSDEDLQRAEEAAAELAALQARVKMLEEVLKPFADIPCLENFDDDQLFDPAGGVYAGDVRRARAALDTQNQRV